MCGFGTNWEYTQKVEMHKIEEYYIAKVKILDFEIFNFCFCNEKDEWDNNYSKNYSYYIDHLSLCKNEPKLELPLKIVIPDEIDVESFNTKEKNIECIESSNNIRHKSNYGRREKRFFIKR